MSCLAPLSCRPFISKSLPLNRKVSTGLVISPLCLFKETRVRQGWNRALGRTKHQQAATTKVVDRRVALWGQSGAVRPERASVWADSISAWHRAGWLATAVPGKGVKSGWHCFLYLAKHLLTKNPSHFSHIWTVENTMYPFHTTWQQVHLVCKHIFP